MHVLTSSTFKRMLHLLKPTEILKIYKFDAFLDAHGGGYGIIENRLL